MPELLHTALTALPPPKIGKVREVYDLGDELLIIATDRISAFDVVMANGIPDKGAILTQISRFWFDLLGAVIPNHFISDDLSAIENKIGGKHPELAQRSTLAKKAKVIPIECVARGYLTGSLYKEYQELGSHVHGMNLPKGLPDGSALPEPLFSPATKAEEGHDENISFQQMAKQVGQETAEYLKGKTLELYNLAASHALKHGIILADTKFEFGETKDGIILIDEVLTPDSSRFWDASLWKPGQAQASFDKQFVRDYLESIHFNKQPPGPSLPPMIVEQTRAKYLEAYAKIVGKPFQTEAS